MKTVSITYLKKAASDMRQHASEQLDAWLVCGESEKYAKAMHQVRVYETAVGIRSIAARREYLLANGL